MKAKVDYLILTLSWTIGLALGAFLGFVIAQNYFAQENLGDDFFGSFGTALLWLMFTAFFVYIFSFATGMIAFVIALKTGHYQRKARTFAYLCLTLAVIGLIENTLIDKINNSLYLLIALIVLAPLPARYLATRGKPKPS